MSEQMGGCSQCARRWPETTFRETARAIANGASPERPVVCDKCIAITSVREGQIAEKIDEVQGAQNPRINRCVIVSGIKSGTNVSSFEYVTHYESAPLTITELCVVFAGDGNETRYVYHNVPVAVCEAWYDAPSKGGYFIQFIKSSYEFEKVK